MNNKVVNKVPVFGQRRAGVYLLSEIYNPDDVQSSVQNLNKVIPAVGSLVIDDTVGNHNTLYVVYSVDAVTHKSTLVNASILETSDGNNLSVSYGNENYMLFYDETPIAVYYKTNDTSVDRSDLSKRYYTRITNSDTYVPFNGAEFTTGVTYYEQRLVYPMAIDGRFNVFTNNATSFTVKKAVSLGQVNTATETISDFYNVIENNLTTTIESSNVPLEAYTVPITTEFGDVVSNPSYHPKEFYSSVLPEQGEKYILMVHDNRGALIAQVVLEAQPMMGIHSLVGRRSIVGFNITANQYSDEDGIFLVRGQNRDELVFYGTLVFADGNPTTMAIDQNQLFVYGLEDIDTNIAGTEHEVIFKYFLPPSEQVVNGSGRNYEIGMTRRYIYKTVKVKVIDNSYANISKISPIFVYRDDNTGYSIVPVAYFANMSEPMIAYYSPDISDTSMNVLNFSGTDLNHTQSVTLQCINGTTNVLAYSRYFVTLLNGADNEGVWYYYCDRVSGNPVYYGKTPRPKLIRTAYAPFTGITLNSGTAYFTLNEETGEYIPYTGTTVPANTKLYIDVSQENYYELFTSVEGVQTNEKDWFLKHYYYNACPPVPYGKATVVEPTHFRIRQINLNEYDNGQNDISTIPIASAEENIDAYFASRNRAIMATRPLATSGHATAGQPATAILEFLVKENSNSNAPFKVLFGVGVDVIDTIPEEEPEVPVDTVRPTVTNVRQNITALTATDVIVYATFSDDVALDRNGKLYKLESDTGWSYYTDGVTVHSNQTVYFMAKDAAGNYSDVYTWNVSNIDKTQPDLQLTHDANNDYIISASVANKQTSDYTVSIWYSPVAGDSALQSIQSYTGPVTFTTAGTYYFKATDGIGNEAIKSVAIATVELAAPVIQSYDTNWTKNDISLGITAGPDHLTSVEYSTDTVTWTPITLSNEQGTVTISTNGTYYFRGYKNGHESQVSSVTITNIDKVPPVLTLTYDNQTTVSSTQLSASSDDNSLIWYSTTDDGHTTDAVTTGWTRYQGAINVSQNATYYIKTVDAAGNVDAETVTFNNIVTSLGLSVATSPLDGGYAATLTPTVTSIDPSLVDIYIYSEYYRGGGIAYPLLESGDYATSGTSRPSDNDEKWRKISSAIAKENGTYFFKAVLKSNPNVVEYLDYNADYILVPTVEIVSTKYYTSNNIEVNKTTGHPQYAVVTLRTTGPYAYFRTPSKLIIPSIGDGYEWNYGHTDDPPNTNPSATTTLTVRYTYNYSSEYHLYILETKYGQYSSKNVKSPVINYLCPEPPVITASKYDPTYEPVILTAEFSGDPVYASYASRPGVYATGGQYKFEGASEWSAYPVNGVEVNNNNTTVYFRAVHADEANFQRPAATYYSEEVSYTVSNIVTEGPADPVISSSPAQTVGGATNWTNGTVTVSAQAGDNTTSGIEYSLTDPSGTPSWQDYSSINKVPMNANGTVWFKAKNSAGLYSNIVPFIVSNIDKDIPTITNITASNVSNGQEQYVIGNVTVTATFGDTGGSGLTVQEYKIENGNWTPYDSSNGVVMSDNGTVYFRAQDAAGNQIGYDNSVSYTVSKITQGLTAPEPYASTDSWTNNDVIVYADFDSNSSEDQYSTTSQNGPWYPYDNGVTMSANGTVWFRSLNNGNIPTQVVSYPVTNIDKVKPTINTPTETRISSNHIKVTVTCTDNTGGSGIDCVMWRMSTDGGTTWGACQSYDSSTGIPVHVNTSTNVCVIDVKAIDVAGNERTLDEDSRLYTVTNTTSIAAPTFAPSTTAATNQPVNVTITFAAGTTVAEISTDNVNWTDVTSNLSNNKYVKSMSSNGTVYARNTDAYGHSAGGSRAINNIDTTNPNAPSVAADVTATTTGPVVVTATFSDYGAQGGTTVKQYSYDNTNWETDSTSGSTTNITCTSNQHLYFKGKDAAGNESLVSDYNVTNIQQLQPDDPEGGEDLPWDEPQDPED